MRPNHKAQILEHLQRHKTITGLEALDKFHCYRLSSVIHRLRRDGHTIVTHDKRTPDGGQYALYQYHSESTMKETAQ